MAYEMTAAAHPLQTPSSLPPLPHRYILGMRVDASSYDDASNRVMSWARTGESRYVCVSTVHMVMEAFDDPEFQAIVNGADLVTSDGMPLVWGLRMLGVKQATRVYGPDLTPYLCARAEREGVAVAFVGGSESTLAELQRVLHERHPRLQIAYAWSPPFRALTAAEEQAAVDAINASGARIVFVGLGCPKQERWMRRHVGRIRAPMLGVGAAFDFVAGNKLMAPDWIQRLGLEWLFRLVTEPKRLWRRYLYHNPRFVRHFVAQLFRDRARTGQAPVA